MATTQRHGKTYVWASWITKTLAGENQCLYQPWYKAHFRYDKRPDTSFDLAAWTADHNALVHERAAELTRDGWTVTLESQNAFKLEGTAAILSGKPDLVATKDDWWLIVDGKTGQPRHADLFQVLVYMFALPKARPAMQRVRGEVCYRGGHRVPIEPEELSTARVEEICALLRRLGAAERPPTTPSVGDCRWCDVADCQDRVVEDASTDPVLVSEF